MLPQLASRSRFVPHHTQQQHAPSRFRDLIAQEYAIAVNVDTEAQRHASVASGGNGSPQPEEPNADEMRRVRLQRFGLGD